jgi:hypothetical protein
MLPFFHMLPRELQARYCTRSPRQEFVTTVSRCLEERGAAAADEMLTRWGQSVSYHDFELAFGALDNLVVADGFHPLLERDKPAREKKGEHALQQFIDDEQLAVPRAFTRANIDVVLQKPVLHRAFGLRESRLMRR